LEVPVWALLLDLPQDTNGNFVFTMTVAEGQKLHKGARWFISNSWALARRKRRTLNAEQTLDAKRSH
jgi:hypothetical protein